MKIKEYIGKHGAVHYICRCDTCSGEFDKRKSQLLFKLKKHFCSNKCKFDYMRMNKAKWYAIWTDEHKREYGQQQKERNYQLQIDK